ncbi:transcriptional regulator [Opitutaceae bacterium TAV5]|nr:transcriptional regulator [Opitutaceae bacterium TAV5]
MPRRAKTESVASVPVAEASAASTLAVDRSPLAAVVADRIAAELRQGRWTGHLPGERQLAGLFQVSRPTLRAALAALESQGLLRTAHGCRREIVARTGSPAAAALPAGGARTVVMISPYLPENIDPQIVLQLESLRELLARRGMTLSIEVRPSCYTGDAAHALERLVAETGADVWLLWHSTKTMQEWFLAKNLPHIVFGTAFHDGASLSVDLDNFATARHAAHTMRRLGHRRIALLMPRLGLAGDNMTEAGFRDGVATAPAGEGEGSAGAGQPIAADIIRHDGTPEGIRRALDHLLALDPRPTGIFSCRGLHTVAVMTYLHSRRLRIPEEISVISRDDDPALDFVNPVPARYHRSPAKFARAVFRLIPGCLARRNFRRKTVRIFPEFRPHGSLGSPPVLRS